MNNRHISSLDGLRGLAALIVFVSHYSNETKLFGGLLGWGGGQLGVMLFFALAGFLMSYLYFDQDASRQAVGQYAIRRVARIYPLFVIVAALPMTLLAIGYPEKVAMADINSFYLYLRQILFIDRGSNVFWSIQVEVFFYFCFVAIWMIRSRGVGEGYIAVGLLALGVLIPTTAYDDGYQWIMHAHLFVFGVLLHLVCKRMTFRISPVWTTPLGLLSLVGILLSFPQVFFVVFAIKLDPWNSLIPLLPVLLLMVCVIKDEGLLRQIFSSRPARFLGRISYSMYLLHYFVLMWVVSYTNPSQGYLVNFLGTFTSVLLLSWISNRWIEVPLQRLVLRIPQTVSIRSKLTERAL